jgi:hypothetical protein
VTTAVKELPSVREQEAHLLLMVVVLKLMGLMKEMMQMWSLQLTS